MTPLILQIIIHYSCTYTDFRDGDFSAEAVEEAIKYLESEEMIRKFIDSDRPMSIPGTVEIGDPIYIRTDKAKFYVDYLCSIPLPVEVCNFEIPVVRADE